MAEHPERTDSAEQQLSKIGVYQLDNFQFWFTTHFHFPNYIKVFFSRQRDSKFSIKWNVFQICKISYLLGMDYIALVEDDICFLDDKIEKVKEILNNIPDDFDICRICYLGDINSDQYDSDNIVNKHFIKVDNNHSYQRYGNQLTLLSRKGMKYYFEFHDGNFKDNDWAFYEVKECLNSKLNVYFAKDKVDSPYLFNSLNGSNIKEDLKILEKETNVKQ